MAILAPALAMQLAVGAAAETAAPRPDPSTGRKLRVACAADIKSLCADVQPGAGRIMQCFRSHRRELQPECRQALRALRNQPAPALSQPAPSTPPYPRG